MLAVVTLGGTLSVNLVTLLIRCPATVFRPAGSVAPQHHSLFAVRESRCVAAVLVGVSWSRNDAGMPFLLPHDAGAEVGSGCGVAGRDATVTRRAHPDELGLPVDELGVGSPVSVREKVVHLGAGHGAHAGDGELLESPLDGVGAQFLAAAQADVVAVGNGLTPGFA